MRMMARATRTTQTHRAAASLSRFAAALVACAAAALPALAQDEPTIAPAPDAPAEYRLGPGDVIAIEVSNEPELSQREPGATVGPDGLIAFHPLGMLQAQGRTCRELADDIAIGLVEKRWVRNPHVTVRPVQFNARKVNVLGAVNTPGSFPHRTGMLVRDAIALAGGVDIAGASNARARLIHADGSSEAIRLDEELSATEAPQAHVLEPGDTLIIERRMLVSVIGYARTPGLLEVEDGTHLSGVLAKAGGVLPEADLANIIIRSPDGSIVGADLEAAILQNTAGTDAGLTDDPMVGDGDVIYVPEKIEDKVSVLGYVESPGQFEIKEEAAQRVSDLIAQAGGAINRPSGGTTSYRSAGDLAHVILTRADGTVETIDVESVLSGTGGPAAQDPLVEAGDTIFVPEERNEVVVLGHVERPGRFLLLPGDTVSDAIATAGGPLRPTTLPATTTSADLANCTLYRASGEVLHVDLSALPTGGTGYDNPEMLPGDTLVIPEARNRVSIEGYVDDPGYYEFRPGETLSAALAMAGGIIPNQGSSSTIQVRHADDSTETIDLAAADPTLRPGDEISVPYARNRVAVVGAVRSPGLYEWHEGDRVVDMIATAGGAPFDTNDQRGGDQTKAVVVRKVDGEQTVIKVDLKPFFEQGDMDANPLLEPEDVIVVPRSDHTDYGNWFDNILSALSITNLVQALF